MRSSRGVGAVGAAGAAGYLLGTIPSADVAARIAGRRVGREAVADLREAGSGNPGAANAAAVLGRTWGLAVLAADMGKGALAGVVGRGLGGPLGAYAAATAAIAGHIVPVWSGGRGGKGVATSAGACLAVFPAYFPLDTAVAVTGAARTQRAERTVWWSCATWVGASVLWWRRRWPNAWGPPAGPGLVLFSTLGSAMILAKFRWARRSS